MLAEPFTLVLLEGASDVAALQAASERAGLALDDAGVRLIDMGGATNVRRHLVDAARAPTKPRVLGMCDIKEGSFFVRALRELDCDVSSVEELPRWGFQICDRDLEDELLRALGPDGVRQVFDGLGLSGRFATFTRQPAWAAREFHDQARRFAGVASGRKEVMAAALAAALDPQALPSPLSRLLDDVVRGGPAFVALGRARGADGAGRTTP
ncbi:hypothetical protein [Humibacillus xanthopallidus]|uniref:hypothetical protein n=1 Tax=Humibacillus xanthopallidus TaxID=412689 RepID=UPI00384E4230